MKLCILLFESQLGNLALGDSSTLALRRSTDKFERTADRLIFASSSPLFSDIGQ
jgi:hypothetical protein